MTDALAIADQAAQVHGQAWASVWAALLHLKVGDIEATERFATRAVELSEAYQIPHFGSYGVFLRGCVAAAKGDLATAIVDMERGLDQLRALGSKPLLPCLLALYGEALAREGRANEALASVAAAMVEVDATSQGWCAAEVFRMKGEILRRSDRTAKAAAEDCFRQALEIAHDHGAQSWELRAATSLARAWTEGGQRRAAHDLLAPIYGRFTEGFDTADLKAAKALLDQLC
jgi:predicted ATPase